MRDPTSLQSRRRTGLRYTVLVFLVFALFAGWSGFWKFAAGKAETTIEGWRAREARAGRIYTCASQGVGGLPSSDSIDVVPVCMSPDRNRASPRCRGGKAS